MPFKLDITLLSYFLDLFFHCSSGKFVSFTLALVMVCMSKFGIKAFMQLPEVIKTMSELIKRGILKFRLNEWLIGC